MQTPRNDDGAGRPLQGTPTPLRRAENDSAATPQAAGKLVHKFDAPNPGSGSAFIPGLPLAFQLGADLQFHIWAEVMEHAFEVHEVCIVGTGWTVPGERWVYFATAQHAGFVWHAFYRRAS